MDTKCLPYLERLSEMTEDCKTSLTTISIRAQNVISYKAQPKDEVDAAIQNESVEPVCIPKDIVDLGTAENGICEDILNEKLRQCYPSTNDTQYYTTAHGSISLRQSLAAFMTKYLHTAKPVDPENLIVTVGCTALLSIISTALTDEGDYILAPRPYYYGLTMDLYGMGKAKVFGASMIGKTLAKGLEDGYEKAKTEGKTIKCVIVLNPDNPTGRVYTKEEVLDVLKFCSRNNLHVIMDEIYALSIFGDTKFDSVLSMTDIPDPMRTHFMWGLSKDFGMSGYRIGVLHTLNQALLRYIKDIIDAFQIPTLIQHIVDKFISDHEWMESVYFPTYNKRLLSSFQLIKERFLELDIPIHPECKAGLYVWADFSKHLKNKTFMEENSLMLKFKDNGVILGNGKSFFATEPGWFRVVFAHSIPVMEEALKRIKDVLLSKDMDSLEI